MRRIRYESLRQGMTQADLARRAHVPQPSLSKVNKGDARLTKANLEKVAIALGWSGEPEELYEEVDGRVCPVRAGDEACLHEDCCWWTDGRCAAVAAVDEMKRAADLMERSWGE